MTNLANNLTFYRKKNNLTQGQLGELLHVSAQAISKWENGQAEPSLDIILKLVEIYHISTDELLSTPQAETAEAPVSTTAPREKKPRCFGKLLRKFWYIPVIALLLIATAVGLIVYLTSPSRYGRMIKNEKIVAGMTKDEVKELLGTPTDTYVSDGDSLVFWEDDLFYDDNNYTYYTYYKERDTKNSDELWFGVKYKYLRLVFNEDDLLIEAFYNNVPSTDVFGYGDVEPSEMTVSSYERILLPNGRTSSNGIVVFDNGSVYLGIVSELGNKIETNMGTFDFDFENK